MQIGAVPLAALGAPALDPALAALGLPGTNLNSQVISHCKLALVGDYFIKLVYISKKGLAAFVGVVFFILLTCWKGDLNDH